MTHTEESLMALFYSAADAIHDSLRDDGGIQIAEGLVAKGMIDALRLAIREVLAERDRYLDIIRREAWLEHAAENDVASPYVPFTDWVAEKNRAEKAEAECERLRKDAERLKGLRKLAGFVEDGSNEAVRLYQDDATKDWFVSVGKRNWFGSSLSAAIDAAIAQERT